MCAIERAARAARPSRVSERVPRRAVGAVGAVGADARSADADGASALVAAKRATAINALARVLDDGTAVAFADTLDMLDALYEMHAALCGAASDGAAPAVVPAAPERWTLPAATAAAIVGRPVDPLGELTLSQLAVVAALCVKHADAAFVGVVVSMEHLSSAAYGATFDAHGARRIHCGRDEPDWAPARLFVIAGTNTRHTASFALASFLRWDQGQAGYYHCYRLHEPAVHDLLGEQMRVAFADAAARTDAETGATLARFLHRLAGAITRGFDPSARVWE
jgi:hypothetical protein